MFPSLGDVPPVGRVRFGSLRRTSPISADWGFERGLPVDRYYIESFLKAHRADIYGRVLEIMDDEYTQRFGAERVARSDVLHPVAGNPKATLVADLAQATDLPASLFDCIVFTQTLNLTYHLSATVKNLHHLLKPGGVLLATVPGIAQISREDMEHWGDYWRFTSASARKLFEAVFLPGPVQVVAYGNVLAAAALLYGLASEELRPAELDQRDPDYEVLIAVRAVKPDVLGAAA